MSVSEHQDESAVRVDRGTLSLEVAFEGDGCVAQIRGELDIEVAPLVEAELLRLIHERSDALSVDISALEYVDSIGLRCLLKVTQEAHSWHRQLRFSQPTGQVARILELTKVNTALPFDK